MSSPSFFCVRMWGITFKEISNSYFMCVSSLWSNFLKWSGLFAHLCWYKGDLNARKPTQCIFNGGWLERTETNLIHFKRGSVWKFTSFKNTIQWIFQSLRGDILSPLSRFHLLRFFKNILMFLTFVRGRAFAFLKCYYSKGEKSFKVI